MADCASAKDRRIFSRLRLIGGSTAIDFDGHANVRLEGCLEQSWFVNHNKRQIVIQRFPHWFAGPLEKLLMKRVGKVLR